MRVIFDGARAGVISALVLTFWSFWAVAGAMESGATKAGMAFVVTAFGFLGLPQMLLGVGLGALVALWAVVFQRVGLIPPGEALRDGEKDRRVGAILLTAPVLVGVVGLGVYLIHLKITGHFNRVGFQALGLGAVAASLTAGVGLISPFVYGVLKGAMERVAGQKAGPFWSLLAGALYGVGALVVLLGGFFYARGLHVWSDTELTMGLAALVLVPLLMGVMQKFRFERGAWTFGIPVAGVLIGSICFALAPKWAVSSPEMRILTLRDAPLMPMIARQMVDLGTDEGDIFAFGECDEDDEDCLIDEAVLPVTSPDHPARRAVQLAVEAGDRAQVNRFESIPAPPKNIVMIVVDTLRQDHMGYAGYHRNTTPNIDEIAKESVVFMDAQSTSPHTPRSIPPLFFSRYASQIRWIGPRINFPRLRDENLSVFEVLQQGGWKNIGMASHFYFDERRNVHQGFEVWDNSEAKDIAGSNTDIATPRIWAKVEPVIEELGKAKREKGDEAEPFSLFVHFFDPHATWNYRSEFGFERGSSTRERHLAAYDSEIAFADRYVGKLVEKLKEEGLYDDVIFVLTSDHGEGFNEHGHYFHGQTLYNTITNVPMLIRVPGWFTRQVEGPVSIIDIAPTLLDLVGLAIPTEFEGESLTSVMLGRQEVPERPIFMELLPYTAFPEHHRAVLVGDQKLIVNFTLGVEEFYDLGEDRGEQNNLIRERGDDAARLREILDEFMQ